MKNGRFPMDERHENGHSNGTSGNGAASHGLAKYSGKTVLAIGAHPDDLEIGCGGTLACLSEAGARVIMAVVSIPNHLEQRREESRHAADTLGCELRLLSPHRPSRVEDLKSYELVGMIDGLIQEFKPAALISHCLANVHTDHKLVYEACMASQRLGYFDFFCYSPTTSRAANIWFTPHAFVDISEKIEQKIQAINCHASQFGGRGLSTDFYREIDRRNGHFIGVKYAEGLEIVRFRLNFRAAQAHHPVRNGVNGMRAQTPAARSQSVAAAAWDY